MGDEMGMRDDIKGLEMAMDKKDLIAFQIEEIDSCMGKNDVNRPYFEFLKQQFTSTYSLTHNQAKKLMQIYERVTA